MGNCIGAERREAERKGISVKELRSIKAYERYVNRGGEYYQKRKPREIIGPMAPRKYHK